MHSFLNAASRGRNNHGLWYALTVICVFLAFIGGQVPLSIFIGSRIASGKLSQQAADEFYRTTHFSYLGVSSAVSVLFILLGFVFALAALLLLVRYLHGRKVSSLVTSGRICWRKVFFALIIWFVITAVLEGILYALSPDAYVFQFDWKKWLPLMVVVILFLPIQTSFEELFVRGYLLQWIGVATHRPWLAALLTAVFFGLMHISNPEIVRFGVGIMMGYYISVGLVLAIITILDDGLEYALGIHAATNIYGAGFVTYSGAALQTDAMFMADPDPGVGLVMFFVSVGVFLLCAHRIFGTGSWKRLFVPVGGVAENTGLPESDIQ